MSEKYIDLYPEITHMSLPESDRNGIAMALHWLDEHPDQVPGRTITERERIDLADVLANERQESGVPNDTDRRSVKAILSYLGITVVPDPEPTNAEKLEAALLDTFGLLEVLGNQGVHNLAFNLDKAGVKAPGGRETDAEHTRGWWIENANVNDAEDCEACVDDLCPVHHGIALGIEFVTKKIAALGDDPELFNSIPNPPKAPGSDDER